MEYFLGTLVLILAVTNILTYISYLEMKNSRDTWYKHSVDFSDKLQNEKKVLDQKWEDLLDENRV